MYTIKMPAGGQTTDESLIAQWHKQVGDKVERGDVLLEIETDKAALEIESYCSGYLRAVLYEEGETASAGAVVAYVGELDEPLPGEEPMQSTSEEQGDDALLPAPEEAVEKDTADADTTQIAPDVNAERVLASPRAKYAARKNDLDLRDIVSKTGVVKEADVLQHLQQSVQASDAYETIPLSNMRKVIARRMCESVYTAPHYSVSIDVDMTECIRLRKQLNASLGDGKKVSFNDIIIKCVAKAIESYPMINSTYMDTEIRIFKDVNVGLAVGIDNGLVVPVVFEANRKSLSQIANDNRRNIAAAREGKLKREEMSGSTISVSSLGKFGVKQFTAVINQPESCILAVGAILEQAVSINHEIVSRDMMTITGSFDHRVIDGALGAQFLQKLKELLETPTLLLL